MEEQVDDAGSQSFDSILNVGGGNDAETADTIEVIEEFWEVNNPYALEFEPDKIIAASNFQMNADLKQRLRVAYFEAWTHYHDANTCNNLSKHYAQEFLVFCFAYIPFGLSLAVANLVKDQKGLSDAEMKLMYGFMAGALDCINANLFHECFRFNKTQPASIYSSQLDKQIQICKDKMIHYFNENHQVTDNGKYPLRTVAKYMKAQFLRWLSDGVPMMFFLLNSEIGNVIAANMDTPASFNSTMPSNYTLPSDPGGWKGVGTTVGYATIMSGFGVLGMMIMRTLTQCIESQPRAPKYDTEAWTSLVAVYKETVRDLKQEIVDGNYNAALMGIGKPGETTKELSKALEDFKSLYREAKRMQAPDLPKSLAERAKSFFVEDPIGSLAKVLGESLAVASGPISQYYWGYSPWEAAVFNMLCFGLRQEFAYPFHFILNIPRCMYHCMANCCRDPDLDSDVVVIPKQVI